MGSGNNIPDLDEQGAKQLIKRLAEDEENFSVFITTHANSQITKRKITRKQVVTVLKTGNITEGPFLNPKHNWQCTVEGYSAGENITVVCAIESNEEAGEIVVVITAYGR